MADPLSDEHLSQMRALARERVSKKRFQHMEGVAETAQLLARTYGQDEKKARLAGSCMTGTRGWTMMRYGRRRETSGSMRCWGMDDHEHAPGAPWPHCSRRIQTH